MTQTYKKTDDLEVTKTLRIGGQAEVKFNDVAGFVPVSYASYGAGSKADQVFFVATRKYKVLRISEVHGTAETTAGTLSAQVTKDSGTDAAGAGDDLLSTAFDLKGTANTVQAGTLVSSDSTLTLNVGDRLAIDVTAAGTEIADVVITADLMPI